MSKEFSYDSREWRALSAQARVRDQHTCTVARLLGGECSAQIHVHHLIPVREDPSRALDIDNLITACSSHHPRVEAMRRFVFRDQPMKRCNHKHRYPGAREACERRLARILA